MTARNSRAFRDHFVLRGEISGRLHFAHSREIGDERPLALVIWRKDEAGLGATLGTVMRGLQVADWLGALPYVDTSRYWTSYSDSSYEGDFPSTDLWHQLFEPLSEVTERRLEEGRYRVLMTDGRHPTVSALTALEDYRKLWGRVRLRHETSAYLSESANRLGLNSSTLGVHFRSGDMRSAPGHPTPPTFEQVASSVSRALDSMDFQHVFVATQLESELERFRARFGKRVVSHPNLRGGNETRRSVIPFASRTRAENLEFGTGFRLAREALLDIFSLSLCGGIVGGTSNITLWAEVMRGSSFIHQARIVNGRNPNSKFRSKVRWHVRSRLPSSLGGFSPN